MSDTKYNCIRCEGEYDWEVLTATPEGNLFCPSCWKQFTNEAKRNCPVDGTEMNKRRIADVILLDVCPACQGTWFDKNELEVLLKKSKDAGWNLGFTLGFILG